MEQMINARMEPVNQMMDQMNQQQQYQHQQQAQAAGQQIAQFNGEFMEDLRMDMADMIDMAAARGRNMSLEEAYDIAASSHPEISKIIHQRESDAMLTGQAENITHKRNAASSIKSTGAAPMSGGDLSIREELEAAWNN